MELHLQGHFGFAGQGEEVCLLSNPSGAPARRSQPPFSLSEQLNRRAIDPLYMHELPGGSVHYPRIVVDPGSDSSAAAVFNGQ